MCSSEVFKSYPFFLTTSIYCTTQFLCWRVIVSPPTSAVFQEQKHLPACTIRGKGLCIFSQGAEAGVRRAVAGSTIPCAMLIVGRAEHPHICAHLCELIFPQCCQQSMLLPWLQQEGDVGANPYFCPFPCC